MSWSFKGVLRLERFRHVQSWLWVCVCVCVCVGGKGGMLTCLRRCRGWWWDSRAPEWWPTVWIGYCPWSCLGGGHPQGLTTAHTSDETCFKLPWAKESNKATDTSKSYLIAGGHDCYNWEFLHLHLCDSYSGQEANLRWTHVSALSQHTLSTLDIMTYRPVCDTIKRTD